MEAGGETRLSRVKNFSRRSIKRMSKKLQTIAGQHDNDLDDLDQSSKRHKPEGLEALAGLTSFTKKELQLMYRGFKQECPTGIVDKDRFVEIYQQFFPLGNAEHYATYVFATFDRANSGSVKFEELIRGLSMLCRGTSHDKLMWTFSLYDINKDGIITKDEMTDIVTSIYEMMGKLSEPPVDEDILADHVTAVFEKLDTNNDGVIDLDEFLNSCTEDCTTMESLDVMDTVLCPEADHSKGPVGNAALVEYSNEEDNVSTSSQPIVFV